MRTKKITVYQFEELSEKAQDKAIKWFQGGLLDIQWEESREEAIRKIEANEYEFNEDGTIA